MLKRDTMAGISAKIASDANSAQPVGTSTKCTAILKSIEKSTMHRCVSCQPVLASSLTGLPNRVLEPVRLLAWCVASDVRAGPLLKLSPVTALQWACAS